MSIVLAAVAAILGLAGLGGVITSAWAGSRAFWTGMGMGLLAIVLLAVARIIA